MAGADHRLKSVYSVNDLSVVDRTIFELKGKLFRRVRADRTGGRWIDFLQETVRSQNETVNKAAIGAPDDVDDSEIHTQLLREANTKKMERNAAQWAKTTKDYRVGDKVFIPQKRQQRGFRRGYKQTMEDEPQEVTRILQEGRALEIDGRVYPTRTVELAQRRVARKRMRAKGPIR